MLKRMDHAEILPKDFKRSRDASAIELRQTFKK